MVIRKITDTAVPKRGKGARRKMKEGETARFSNRLEVKGDEWRLKFPGLVDLKFALAPESHDSKELQRLAGKLAYLRMLNPDQAAPLVAKFKRARGFSSGV